MASAYCTVSEPNLMVITKVISVALLVKERKTIYRRKGDDLRQVAVHRERRSILTAQLIDNLDPWLSLGGQSQDYKGTISCSSVLQ